MYLVTFVHWWKELWQSGKVKVTGKIRIISIYNVTLGLPLWPPTICTGFKSDITTCWVSLFHLQHTPNLLSIIYGENLFRPLNDWVKKAIIFWSLCLVTMFQPTWTNRMWPMRFIFPVTLPNKDMDQLPICPQSAIMGTFTFTPKSNAKDST